jgi:hypothetical protein
VVRKEDMEKTLTTQVIHRTITTLIGPIEPVAETHTDAARFENLKVMTEVLEMLLVDVKSVARNKGRVEYSMNLAGKHADNFLNEIKEATQ